MKKKIAYGVTGLILGCIFLFPIYILIMNSFKTTKGIFTDVLGFPAKGTFTLENYKNAFQELDYIRSFMNSLLITVVTAVLVLLISAMAAWVLVRYKTKASKIIFLIFVYLGIKFIFEAFEKQKEKRLCIDIKCLLLVGIATSIDAFSAGISLSLAGNHILKPAILIALITFINSCAGFALGGKLKHLPTKSLEIFAGILLILIGFKALI